LLEAFKIRIDERQAPMTPRYQVYAELDLAQWQRRRRHDGFSVIIAHPAVLRTAAELCQLYRAKDAVEKDFQIIKGLVRLRPIWHHTDAKVRAHVTLCMLALLLERTLNERLRHVSAEQAIETLSTCCLNRFQDTHGKSHYVVTQPDEAQQALLRELELTSLAEDNDIVERVRPR
jgi:transposase